MSTIARNTPWGWYDKTSALFGALEVSKKREDLQGLRREIEDLTFLVAHSKPYDPSDPWEQPPQARIRELVKAIFESEDLRKEGRCLDPIKCELVRFGISYLRMCGDPISSIPTSPILILGCTHISRDSPEMRTFVSISGCPIRCSSVRSPSSIVTLGDCFSEQAAIEGLFDKLKTGSPDSIEMYCKYPEVDVAISSGSAILLAAEKGDLGAFRWLVNRGSPIESINFEGQTTLMRAAKNGHLELIKEILRIDPSLARKKDEKGKTALILAAENNKFDVVRYLVDFSEIGATDSSGRQAIDYVLGNKEYVDFFISKGALNFIRPDSLTRFFIASCYGELEIVEAYLDKPDIDIDALTFSNETALDMAIKCDQLEVVKLLFFCKSSLGYEEVEPLMMAASYGYLDIVELLLGFYDINSTTDESEESALFFAIKSNQVQVVKFLVERGININFSNIDGQTPLMVAISLGQKEIMEYLASQPDIQLDAQTDYGESAISIAVRKGDLETVKYLISCGASKDILLDKEETLLMLAAYLGDIPMMEYFVEVLGLDIEARDEEGETAIFYAIKSKNVEVVRWLVDHGALVHVQDNPENQITPIIRAASIGVLDIIKYLILECFVDINSKTESGLSVLMISSEYGHIEICRWLIDNGANVKLRCAYGYDAFLLAVDCGQVETVKFLADLKEIDITTQSFSGITAISLAAKWGYLEIVKFLVQRGLDPKGDQTLLILASKCESPNTYLSPLDHEGVVEYLVSCGVDVNAMDATGKSAIFYVAESGNLEIVRHLVENGAFYTLSDDTGMTPLMYAIKNNHTHIVAYLLSLRGINLNAKDNNLKSAITWAIESGNPDIIMLVLNRRGSTLEISDEEVKELYGKAMQMGNIQIIRWLVENNKIKVSLGDLNNALVSGDKNICEYLANILTSGDINGVSESGRTTLMHAADNGYLLLVKWLVEDKHADFRIRDRKGNDAFFYALMKGRKDVVEYLLGLDIDLEAENKEGKSLIALAMDSGNLEMIMFLLENLELADDEIKILHDRALASANIPIIEWLIKNDKVTTLDLEDVLRHGQIELLENIIQILTKGNINDKDDSGITLLMRIASNGCLLLVKWLVEEGGADIRVEDRNGLRAVSYALGVGHKEVVEYFISLGIDFEAKDAKGRTILFHAVEAGDLAFIRWLIEGRKILTMNPLDNNGFTPVMWAIFNDKPEIAKYILEQGQGYIRTNFRNINGITILTLAIQKGFEDFAKWAITGDYLSPTYQDGGGYSPLYYAVSRGSLDLVKFLCENPDVKMYNLKGDIGKSILRRAVQLKHIDIVEYLVQEQDLDVDEELMQIARESNDRGFVIRMTRLLATHVEYYHKPAKKRN